MMPMYKVLLPSGGSEPIGMADRASFIREGLCWPALLFGPLWMLARGLWRPLGVWCLGALLVAYGRHTASLSIAGAVWLYLLSAVYLALEGRNLVAAAIERRGFALVDIVSGADSTAAEQVFFARWLADENVAVNAAARPDIPAAQTQVLGLFPEAGG
jgi:hypothetical protein